MGDDSKVGIEADMIYDTANDAMAKAQEAGHANPPAVAFQTLLMAGSAMGIEVGMDEEAFVRHAKACFKGVAMAIEDTPDESENIH